MRWIARGIGGGAAALGGAQLLGGGAGDIGQQVQIVHQRGVDDRHRIALQPIEGAGHRPAHQVQIGAHHDLHPPRRGVEGVRHVLERAARLARRLLEPERIEPERIERLEVPRRQRAQRQHEPPGPKQSSQPHGGSPAQTKPHLRIRSFVRRDRRAARRSAGLAATATAGYEPIMLDGAVVEVATRPGCRQPPTLPVRTALSGALALSARAALSMVFRGASRGRQTGDPRPAQEASSRAAALRARAGES